MENEKIEKRGFFNLKRHRRIDMQMLDYMSKDRGNWKGPFYYNPKDPRLMVPKFDPTLGWTLNFASPSAYIALGAIIVIGIVVKMLI